MTAGVANLPLSRNMGTADEVVAAANAGGAVFSAANAVAELLQPSGSGKAAAATKAAGDGETPETGTPATRSLSPSSDGDGASREPSDFGANAGNAGVGGGGGGAGRQSRGLAAKNGGEVVAEAAAANYGALAGEASEVMAGSAEAPASDGTGGAEEPSAVGCSGTGGGSGRGGDASNGSAGRGRKGEGRGKGTGRGGAVVAGTVSTKGVGKAWMRPAGLAPVPVPPCVPGPGCPVMSSNSFSDRRIIEVLAAPSKMHRRLVRTAQRVPEIILDNESGTDSVASSADLYGSLALDIGMNVMSGWKQDLQLGTDAKQDWASYYVNSRSDIDFVVDMRPGVSPAAVAERFVARGHWHMVGQVQVHKFASTQFTLLGKFNDEGSDDEDGKASEEGSSSDAKEAKHLENDEHELKNASAKDEGGNDEDSRSTSSTGDGKIECKQRTPRVSEVYLDITCIENPTHFKRFRKRQKAFREVFTDARTGVENQFGAQGALAFDAYIHLLKAFAAKVPGNALTGFQATCLGLFTLQIGHFRLKPTHSIALSFFEGFLRFCLFFYGDGPQSWSFNYRQFAIDLSQGGRWLPRMSTGWRSELYFMQVEDQMKCRPDERVNVAHSLDPHRVCVEAYALLQRAFTGDHPGSMFMGQGAPMAVPAAPVPQS